jgi:putative addiction module component (TIGR02574 family)
MIAEASPYETAKDCALHLPLEDRSRLASCILESLDEDEFELSSEWREEIQKRIKAVEEGRSKLIPATEVWEEVNQRFGTNF